MCSFTVEKEIDVMAERKKLREVCEMLGISRRTVQGYEKKGIVKPSGKNKYGYLLYDKSEIEKIAFAQFLQSMGFSLDEIAHIMRADNSEKARIIGLQIEVMKQKIDNLNSVLEKSLSIREKLSNKEK